MGLGRRLLSGQIPLAAVDLHPGARTRKAELVDRAVGRIPPLLGDVLPAAVVIPRHVGYVAAERRPTGSPAVAPGAPRRWEREQSIAVGLRSEMGPASVTPTAKRMVSGHV